MASYAPIAATERRAVSSYSTSRLCAKQPHVLPGVIADQRKRDYLERAEYGAQRYDGRPWIATYKWPIYFFVAVAFWNLVGAGIFGFLINPPIALHTCRG